MQRIASAHRCNAKCETITHSLASWLVRAKTWWASGRPKRGSSGGLRERKIHVTNRSQYKWRHTCHRQVLWRCWHWWLNWTRRLSPDGDGRSPALLIFCCWYLRIFLKSFCTLDAVGCLRSAFGGGWGTSRLDGGSPASGPQWSVICVGAIWTGVNCKWSVKIPDLEQLLRHPHLRLFAWEFGYFYGAGRMWVNMGQLT